jgi:hypothetical protein
VARTYRSLQLFTGSNTTGTSNRREDPPPEALNRLPTELKLQILEDVVHSQDMINVHRDAATGGFNYWSERNGILRVELAEDDILAIAETHRGELRDIAHQCFLKGNHFSFRNIRIFLAWLRWIGEEHCKWLRSITVFLTPEQERVGDIVEALTRLGKSIKLCEFKILLRLSGSHDGSLTMKGWFAKLEDLQLHNFRGRDRVFEFKLSGWLVRGNSPYNAAVTATVAKQHAVLDRLICSTEGPGEFKEVYQEGSSHGRRVEIAKTSPTDLDSATLKRWAKDICKQKDLKDLTDLQIAQRIANYVPPSASAEEGQEEISIHHAL